MTEDIYFRLGERLNHYQVKMLLVDGYLNILREIYTEEEARVGAEVPLGSYTAAELSEKLGRDEAPLTSLLEIMADKGTVFVTKTEEGIHHYALTPFVPGVVEFQLMRGTDTPRDRKFALMLEEFQEGEMKELMTEVFKDSEMTKSMIPNAPARTITVEEELPQEATVHPFEQVTALVEQEDSFAAAKCYCRHHAFLLDKPCEIEGVPEYSCLMFGKTADYVVDRGFGKRITREEALRILEETEKAGLVHNTNNFIDSTAFICNCCGCCCGFLKMLKQYDTDAILACSNFMVHVDAEECTGCGDCVERCQMEALGLSGDTISLEASRCIGCGNCVTACPTKSLSMVRRAEEKPPVVGRPLAALGI